MARYGITYLQVVDAAHEIRRRNQVPTIEKIRALLGSGSHTTISKHLKKWRNDEKCARSPDWIEGYKCGIKEANA